MRKQLIESYIDRLRASFGPARRPVAEEELRAFYDAKDYEKMVLSIQNHLHLDLRVFLGLVNKGGSANVPAWAHMPSAMPLIGTPAFRAVCVTIYLRKSFIAESSFETLVAAIAHEFAHVVLNGVGHSLRYEEEAVDLTAMLLGFRDFFVTGCSVVKRQSFSTPESSIEFVRIQSGRYGYLSEEEVSHAAEYMTFR